MALLALCRYITSRSDIKANVVRTLGEPQPARLRPRDLLPSLFLPKHTPGEVPGQRAPTADNHIVLSSLLSYMEKIKSS